MAADDARLETRYDAIVIGAGHNGLAAAIGLARDGLKTLVIEQDQHVGGQAVADETLRPGFLHHPHANALAYLDLAPRAKALDFIALGLETITPRAQHGICFRDGRPPVVLYRTNLTALSLKSLRRYSYRDAKTYGLLKARADKLTSVLADTFYGSPDPSRFDRQRSAIEAAFKDMAITDRLGSRSAQQTIDDLFFTPEIRTLLYRLSTEFGAPLREPGGDLAFLGLVMWMLGRRRLPTGGMSNVPELLKRTFEDAGGKLLLGAAGVRVRTDAGRVRGVVADGLGDIEAPLVMSSIGVSPTYRDLLAQSALPPDVASELVTFDAAPSPAIGNLKLCLHDAPSYKGADREPDIDQCLQVFIGLDEPQDVLGEADEIAQGQLPSPAGSIRVNTLWDPRQAPAGFHSAGVDCAFPDPRQLGDDIVRAIEQAYGGAFLDTWRAYAPNMTADNVLASAFKLTGGYDRKMLLRTGGGQYRTHIEGLYHAGASTYPGGGVHGACAHNAVEVVRQDRRAAGS